MMAVPTLQFFRAGRARFRITGAAPHGCLTVGKVTYEELGAAYQLLKKLYEENPASWRIKGAQAKFYLKEILDQSDAFDFNHEEWFEGFRQMEEALRSAAE